MLQKISLEGNGNSNYWFHNHIWELTGNYPIFSVVMVIYDYIARIGAFSLPPIFFCIIYKIKKTYYPGEELHKHMY